MLQLKVISRSGTLVRYGFFDEEGRLVKAEERDAAAEIEESRRTHVGLATILARAEGIEIVGDESESLEEAPVGIAVAPAIETTEHEHPIPPHVHEHSHDINDLPHEHEEFLRAVRPHEHAPHSHPPADHSHSEAPVHDHPPHDHPVGKHGHELEAHGHAALDLRLKEIESQVEALAKHNHPHEHPHKHDAEFTAFYERLSTLWDELQGTLERLRGHEHAEYMKVEEAVRAHRHEGYELTGHEHELTPHRHDEREHEHPLKDHGHAVPAHEHPVGEHGHPEIVGLFTPQEKAAAVELKGVHLHRFDTMENDGLGWKCGICNLPKDQLLVERA